ncbi:uncharacterized protein LOC126555806 [Aphis gossypii]|uniref:uncharacterized protein LOC126555806 n=1 Tax=Aphis gossypii TaxID=80765 RepID=UPI002158E9E8|nr:uncharacterized protein LOC126555806 [Aphis gossypii]
MPAGKKPGRLHPIPPGRRPFEIVHIDHLGPFETSTTGNKYLFVLVDNLNKFTHLYPCRSTDTASVLNRLDKFCRARGIPDRISSVTVARASRANGQVERVNRTIVPLLSILTEDQVHWDDKVPEVERHLNSAVNKTSELSPFEALYGYRPRFVGGTLGSLSQACNAWTAPQEVQTRLRDTITVGQNRMKLYYDQRHHEGVRYDVGEVVVMLRQPKPDQPSKLQAKYRVRPLQVIEVLPGDTYRVAEVASDGREVYATTAHLSQLKSWKIFREHEDEVPAEVEAEDEDAVQETARDVRHKVEEQDGATTTRPVRKRRPPAHLSDYSTD